jgi:hypothetical protein
MQLAARIAAARIDRRKLGPFVFSPMPEVTRRRHL